MYASRFWHIHARSLQTNRHLEVLALVLRLLDEANAAKAADPTMARRSHRNSSIHEISSNFVCISTYHASSFGILEACKYLIENGADVTVKNKGSYGMTALREATKSGYLEILKLLVEEDNVDKNARTVTGVAGLHSAADHGELEVVK